MTIDDDVCHRALTARDPRFDGLFFVGVKSTGIYCRPICPARTPARTRCRFFVNAALAEQAGFRPCLRCRPELAPGHAPVDSLAVVARAAAARIEAGAFTGGGDLEQLAASFGLSSRQLRRSVRKEFGDLAGLGLPAARARSLQNFARVVAARQVDLGPGTDPAAVVAQLVELPGIGPWTAQYISMRALHWPDAFPTGDLGLAKAMGLKSARLLERASEPWRPWRAYAAMHLWESLNSLGK